MTDDESSVWESEKFRAVLASTLVLPLGVALVSPGLPVIRDSFAITDARTSLLITLYFLPGIFLSPIIGMLADRYGRRTVMLPSLVVFGLAGGVIVLVNDFTVLLAFRVVQGAAAAGVFILTVTFISDVFDGVDRNTALGINSAVLFAGAAIFPLIGGILSTVDWHVPFLLYLVALPVAYFAFPRLGGPPVIQPKTGPEYLKGAAAALPPREAASLYGAAFFLEAIAFGAILTTVPFLLVRDFATTSAITGVILSAMMVVAGVVASMNGTLVTKRSNHRLVVLSFWCYGVGLFVAWAGTSIPIILAGVAIVGAGFGLVNPSVDAAIGRIAPAEYRAGALSIRNATTFLGRATGPIAFTAIAIVTGYHGLLLASAVGAFCIGIIGWSLTDGEPHVLDEPSPQ